ncbi:Adenine specific DNA methylase Mod [Apilactobacillus kunkeei]|nr:Adenine specific DNA methylase Mod [Apilactobacillus kunkeei]
MKKIEPRLFDELKKKLLSFGNKYFVGDELNRTKVSEDLRSYDEQLLQSLFEISFINNNFFKEIDGKRIFLIDQLEEAILYDDYWDTSYTKYENKIGLTDNKNFIEESGNVVLDFPFKDGVLTASMTKEDKENGYDDSFLNETIEKDEIDRLFDKKIFNNVERYDKNGVKDTDYFNVDKDNLILKGNNLLALHTIKNKFAGKIKMIYIDPPYNTGKDSFLYNDNFSRSSWLTFMKNRLEIARELLSEDGSIFVSIDENQEAYLRVLMNDIFGENNSLEVFHIQARYTQKSLNEKDNFQPVMEYVLSYAKNKNKFVPNKPYDDYDLSKFKWEIEELAPGEETELGGKKVHIFKKGEYRINKMDKPTLEGLKDTWASGSVLTGNTSGKFFDQQLSKRKEIDGLQVLYKVEGIGDDGLGYRYFTGPKKETSIRGQFYSGIPLERLEQIKSGSARKYKPIVNYKDFSGDFGNIRHEGGVPFNGGKKPEKMLKWLIEMATNKNDLVLDFHLGSGSTAATAMKLNRRFIGIEQMDYIKELAVKRLQNVINGDTTGISSDVNWSGGGEFVYSELMQKNMGYLLDLINSKTMNDLHEVYERMKMGVDGSKEFADILFQADLEKIEWDKTKISFTDQRKLLIKLLDKNGLYYNYSEIDDEDVRDFLTDSDYKFNKNFYESGE